MGLKEGHFEDEVIRLQDKLIETDRDRIRLKRELFVVEADLEAKDAIIADRLLDIAFYKTEIKKLQAIDEELSRELEEAHGEVKYWYRIKSPTFRTVFRLMIERILHAANNFKR